MDYFKNMFKSREKLLLNITVLFLVGFFLMVSSGMFNAGGVANNQNSNDGIQNQGKKTIAPTMAQTSENYERQLERRLEEVLTTVHGVGEVKVMLTLSNGREIIVAENSEYDKKSTKETDSSGSIKESEDLKTKSEKIIINGKGTGNEPLVLKEIEPKIEGVVIVAQGGDDIMIKDALVRASQIVLGVEPHKVQVLKMK